MVKFSKQFEGQLVPEWKEAFVDYCKLKKDLKKIHLLNNTTNNTTTSKHKNTSSSLSNTFLTSLRNLSLFGPQHRNHEVIHVLLLSLSFSFNPNKIQFFLQWVYFVFFEFIFCVYVCAGS